MRKLSNLLMKLCFALAIFTIALTFVAIYFDIPYTGLIKTATEHSVKTLFALILLTAITDYKNILICINRF